MDHPGLLVEALVDMLLEMFLILLMQVIIMILLLEMFLILLMQVMMMILQFQELEESMSIIHQWIPIESSLSVFSRLMFNSLWHLFSSLLLQSGLLLKVCDCYAYTLLFIIISS